MTISRRNILGAAGAAVMANILPVRAEMPSKEGDMTQHESNRSRNRTYGCSASIRNDYANACGSRWPEGARCRNIG